MSNHPNRSGHGQARNPSRDEILSLLALGDLTQFQAAGLIHVTSRNMDKWIAREPTGRMHPAFWRLLKMEIALRRTPELRDQMELALKCLDEFPRELQVREYPAV